MADKRRSVNTAFWDDEYVGQLDPSEKLLFLYLLTNPLTNIAGVYPIQLRRIAFDTGFDQEMVKKILGRFAADGKAFYEVGWIVLKNFLKNQALTIKTEIAAGNSIKAAPLSLQKRLLDESDELCIGARQYLPHQEFGIPHRYPIDTPSINKKGKGKEERESETKREKEIKTSTSVLGPRAAKDERDAEVQQVIDKFQQTMSLDLPRMQYQRRAAKTLITKFTLTKTLAAIDVAAAIRDYRFAPKILSLEQLRDKWNDLVEFYRKQQTPQKGDKGGLAVV
jgi:hypothetical protein